jgi:signal transduction histidine kinase/CHASE1-domain containing sensor protein
VQKYLSEFKNYWIALLIFLLGILFSIGAFRFYENQELKQTRIEFNRLADIRIFLIKNEIIGIIEQINNIKNFFNASSHVSKDEFNTFTSHTLELYPDLIFLGWYSFNASESVLKDNKPLLKFISSKAELNNIHYHFFSLDYLEQSHPQKIFYIEQKEYLQFERLLEIQKHVKTAAVSDTIEFFQSGIKKGFFIFDSVFNQNSPSNLISNNLRGIIIGLANFEEIVQKSHLILQPTGFNIDIFDHTDSKEILLLHHSSTYQQTISSENPEEVEQFESWSQSYSFPVGNRTWMIKISPNRSFFQNHKRWTHWEVLIIGILFSALPASYFLFLVNRNLTIEQIVAARTNELADSNLRLENEILERKKIEENLTKKQRYLQARHEALKYFTKLTISEIQNAVNEVISRTATVMQIDRASIWFYETKENIPCLTCAGLYPDVKPSLISLPVFLNSNYPLYFQSLNNHAHLILPSVFNPELTQEFNSYLQSFHIISKLDIPIVFEGKLLGVLACEATKDDREWLLEDIHFGQTVADIVAIMMEQAARRQVERALQESRQRLVKAMKEAQAANEAKTEFLTTISHELRTPLNAMIGFNQILLMEMEGPINESQRLSLKKIEKSSFRLLGLINDILDLAKIEANKMELEIHSSNIAEVIKSCVEEITPLVEQKDIRISWGIDKPIINLEMDQMRIRQVILNLLSNAVKFTEQGEISIQVYDHPSTVEIQVMDTGIGLTEEEIDKIFQPFTQADNSITRKFGGTGLGLAISKKIIHLHKGSLEVKSKKEKGSVFIVILPKSLLNIYD